MERRFAVIYESGPENWSAYVPDLPVCVAVGNTLEECRISVKEAIAFHIEGLLLEGFPVPEPSTVSDMVDVA